MAYTLSPSSLGLLEECQRCFWLYVVKRISRPAGPFPSLPSGIDKIIKERFDGYREKGELPPELKKEGVDAELFPDRKLLDAWRNNRQGIRYLDEAMGVTLMGAVDEMLRKNGKLIVLDFKTRGFAPKEDTAHYYQDQLDLYNLLLRKNGYDTEDYAYLLFYVPEKINGGGDFIFDTTLVKMPVDVKHAEELFRKAVGVLKAEMPASGADCAFCRWKENVSNIL